MHGGQPFVDYYDILGVRPDCDPKSLDAAYRDRAKMYHPDHNETADVTKFNEVIEAYRVLRNAEARARYDILYSASGKKGAKFPSQDDFEFDEKSAISDADIHDKILLFLYRKRRERAADAGVVGYFVQKMLQCPDEQFEFHLWYLKAKGFIEVTEQGTLAITIQGVDQVIAMSRTTLKEKLLIAQSSDSAEQPPS